MAKEYASKTTREIMTDHQIKDAGLDKTDFVDSWKGKIIIINPELSEIAQELSLKKKGVFAVKLR